MKNAKKFGSVRGHASAGRVNDRILGANLRSVMLNEVKHLGPEVEARSAYSGNRSCDGQILRRAQSLP
jgi:hypothetical protein